MNPNAQRKRSCSDTRESRLPLAIRPHGTARLSRANSTLCSRLSRQSSRSSTRSSKAGQDALLPSDKLATPKSRLDIKSPQRLKALYTNVDEKLTVKRVMALVQAENLEFQVSKLVNINDFVGITQMLFSMLLHKPKLTLKNYKTEIPINMKLLKYPITISQSFMKTPNTSSNYQNVMSMWAFLLDIVEEMNEPWTDIDMIPSLTLSYILKSKEDEATARAEVIDAVYASYGVTEAEVTKEMANVDRDTAAATEALNDRKKEICTMETAIRKQCDEIAEVTRQNQHVIQQQAAANKTIKKTTQAIEYNQKCLLQAVKEEEEREKQLHLINEKIQANGHSLEEIEELDRQIKLQTLRDELTRKRNQELSDQRRAQQDKRAELEARAIEQIYEFNKIIIMSTLPEDRKRALMLDEKEISLPQIVKAIEVMRQFKQQAEESGADYQEMVNKATELSLVYDSKLVQATRAAEDARMQSVETAQRLHEATNEAADVHALGDLEVEKITSLLRLKQKMELEYANAEPRLQQYMDATQRQMECMKSTTEEIVRGVADLVNYKAAAINEQHDYMMEVVNELDMLIAEVREE